MYVASSYPFLEEEQRFFIPIVSPVAWLITSTPSSQFESDGTIRDSSGYRKAEIDSDGTIRDSSGYRLGEVESDGTVRDSSGCKIGEASGMSKEQAAYHFFFK